MSDALITALVMALSSIICQVLINRNNRNKRTKEETDKARQAAIDAALKDQAFETRLRNIETKLDIHNGYAEKLGEIATSIAVIQSKLESI